MKSSFGKGYFPGEQAVLASSLVSVAPLLFPGASLLADWEDNPPARGWSTA